MNVDEPIGVSWFSRSLLLGLIVSSGLACSSSASPTSPNVPGTNHGKEGVGSSSGTSSSGGSPTGSSGGSGGSSGGSSSGGGSASGSGAPGDGGVPTAGSDAASPPGLIRPYHDPGTGPWEMVAPSDVASVCKLDLSKLQAAEMSNSWPFVVVRYGKVCYATASAKSFAPAEAWSTTKTLGATVTGIAAYQSRNLPMTGPKTGPMTDMDRADKWLAPGSFTYNKDALLAHVMGMVAQDASLAAGQKTFSYDTVGSVEINSLSNVINAVVAQNTSMLTANIETFTQKFVFAPLGMTKSTWSTGSTTKVFAYSWSTDLLDMARIGLLLLDWGWWNGERLLDQQWVYRMTHPSFEDANTGFGYLTWLNSASNWESIAGGKTQGAGVPGTCAPVCLHKKYPHGASQNTDCNYSSPYTCTQKYDVGVFQAEGLMGQLIQGHRGLDIVIVARNAEPGGSGPGTAKIAWDAISPAVIAGDPMYKGDMTSFCKDYGGNNYAPDMHEDPPEL